MSKKKKRKKHYLHQANNVINPSNDIANGVSNSMTGITTGTTPNVVEMATTVSVDQAPVLAPVKPSNNDRLAPVYNAHAAEYAMVRHDLIRVAIVNGIFLAAVLTLYYANRAHPFLEIWYTKVFH